MQRLWQHWSYKTQDEDIQNKTHNTTKKAKKQKMSNTDPAKMFVLAKVNQFLLFIRHHPCY